MGHVGRTEGVWQGILVGDSVGKLDGIEPGLRPAFV